VDESEALGTERENGDTDVADTVPRSSTFGNEGEGVDSIPGVPLLSDSEDGGLGGFRVFGFTCAMPALPCYTSLCRSQESHGS